jgi:hypothetical protein
MPIDVSNDLIHVGDYVRRLPKGRVHFSDLSIPRKGCQLLGSSMQLEAKILRVASCALKGYC